MKEVHKTIQNPSPHHQKQQSKNFLGNTTETSGKLGALDGWIFLVASKQFTNLPCPEDSDPYK